MKKSDEAQCNLCEYAQEIECGEKCICRIRGVVLPDDVCRRFRFDPLKIKVSIPKMPAFSALADLAKKGL